MENKNGNKYTRITSMDIFYCIFLLVFKKLFAPWNFYYSTRFIVSLDTNIKHFFSPLRCIQNITWEIFFFKILPANETGRLGFFVFEKHWGKGNCSTPCFEYILVVLHLRIYLKQTITKLSGFWFKDMLQFDFLENVWD